MPGRPSYPAQRLDYELPPELIAQQPLPQRSASRLLHVRSTGISDRLFSELPALLPPGCLIVFNDSRVIPARLWAARALQADGRGGGRVEILYHRWLGGGECEAVVGSNAPLRAEEVLELPQGWRCELLEPKALDGIRVRFILPDGTPAELSRLLHYLDQHGETPLPPYIKRDHPAVGLTVAPVSCESRTEPSAPPTSGRDRLRYQTVYAANPGSVAAPTAGLHFDEAMLARLRADGHQLVHVTLHVGLGTFAPLRVDDLRDHGMHAEAFSVSAETYNAYFQAREQRQPVLAVGTTSLRVLHTLCGGAAVAGGQPESYREQTGSATASRDDRDSRMAGAALITEFTGMTRAFIYPGQDTAAADLLLTNFHLPRSTLLALVYSFGGEELMRAAYAHAIESRYRFFSYGDCMLIDRTRR